MEALPTGGAPVLLGGQAVTRGIASTAVILAGAASWLLFLPPSATAQSVPPCDPAAAPAISFEGLPTGLAPLRYEGFGFRENYDSEGFVSGRIAVEMTDRFGDVFFSGSVGEDVRGGRLFFVGLDRGDRRVSITASFVETSDAGDCFRVIERLVAENPPMDLTIRASRRGAIALGTFRFRSSPTFSVAVRAFGEPSRVRGTWGGSGCRVSWPLVGLTVQFANFGGYDACSRRYGRAQSAAIRGRAGRQWRTTRGLRIGDSVTRLRRRHPSADRHGARWWWLVTGRTFIGPSCDGGPCPYAVLSAGARTGKVAAFRMWIGSAGD